MGESPIDKEKERISCLSQHYENPGDGLSEICSESYRPECLKWREVNEPRNKKNLGAGDALDNVEANI